MNTMILKIIYQVKCNNKKIPNKNKNVKKSISSQKSGGTSSLINSVIESGNSKRKKTISTIEENLEGYNDFNPEIDEDINNNEKGNEYNTKEKNNTDYNKNTNESQVIPEEKISNNINSSNTPEELIRENNNNVISSNNIPEDINKSDNKNISPYMSNSNIKESIPQNIKSTVSIPEEIPNENKKSNNKFNTISGSKYKISSISSKEIDEIINED